ncbi:Crp/Fnr family transcriptional regulator [Spirochaetia bacterium]|nr:Crp/Fnr family transcriptional regulator [Spirochaetia bacterium]
MTVPEALKKITVLTAASPASLAELIPYGTIRQYQKGEHISLERDDVRHFFCILDGIAALYKINSVDEKRGIFVYGSGAMLNEVVLDGKTASVNCEVLKDATVLCLERNGFLSVCRKDFGLSKAVMDSMALKIRRLYHQLKNTSTNIRGDKRIASKLWKLSRDFGVGCGRGTEIDFDLTITYLAELLGGQRETVSRQVKLLTGQGLVIVDKSRFIIPDREKLLDFFENS